jgi:hypothetical protein
MSCEDDFCLRLRCLRLLYDKIKVSIQYGNMETSSLRTLKIMSSTKLYVHEFGFWPHISHSKRSISSFLLGDSIESHQPGQAHSQSAPVLCNFYFSLVLVTYLCVVFVLIISTGKGAGALNESRC